MAAIARRIRKMCGRVRKFITNKEIEQEIPHYDSLNDLNFWEDIVGTKQVQLIRYRPFKTSFDDSNAPFPDKEHDDEALESVKNDNSNIEIFRDNIDWRIEDGMNKQNSKSVEFFDVIKDSKTGKEMEPAEEVIETIKCFDESCKMEIIRDNIDWSSLDDMKEEFENKYLKHHVKKQNTGEKNISAAQGTSKKQTVAERIRSQKECQNEINPLDCIEEGLNIIKSTVKEALFICAETWRSELDNFLQNSDEVLAVHYREYLHAFDHLQFNEAQFENIFREAIELDGRNVPTQNQDPNRLLQLLDQERNTHVLNSGFESGDEK